MKSSILPLRTSLLTLAPLDPAPGFPGVATVEAQPSDRSFRFRRIRAARPFVRSFSRFVAGVCALWVASSPSANGAGLIEPFAYSNGNLTDVSGGAWQFWEPGAGDATVVNGAMRFDGTTDVIRTFPAVLTAPGQTATISFTITVNLADTSEGYAMDFLPSSAPFNANTNYGNQFSLGFDYEAFANQGDGRA